MLLCSDLVGEMQSAKIRWVLVDAVCTQRTFEFFLRNDIFCILQKNMFSALPFKTKKSQFLVIKNAMSV